MTRIATLLLSLICWSSVASGQEFLKQFPLHKKSKFFELYFKQNPQKMEEIARFADGFVRVVHRQFFKSDFEYPIKLVTIEDRERFQAFLVKDMNISDPPYFGIYFHELRMFITYEDSGLGTFAHEILHPLVTSNLPLHPVWATEGIPTFFEKFYGYWEGEELVLKLGFHNPWRLQAMGEELPRLDLKQILNYKDTQGRFRESEQRMVSMFLWDKGKFKTLLKLIEKGEPPPGYQTWFEATMEMEVDKVVPLWDAWLRDEVVPQRRFFRLPASTVLPDKAAYEAFMIQHGMGDLMK
jgi:hypothetical protein